jgi:hypothetical protein
MVSLLPALAVAEPFIVIVIVDTAAVVHPVLGLAVSVSVTTPVSPDNGVYVGVNVVPFVSAPVPVVVHCMLE